MPSTLPKSLSHYIAQETKSMLSKKLGEHGIRTTAQRLALAQCLFSNPDRHITAEQLHNEVTRSTGVKISLATVYNTLNTFRDAGLLRGGCVDGTCGYFDTHLKPHVHIFNEDTQTLMDAPSCLNQKIIESLLPEGLELIDFDVMIRARRPQDDSPPKD